ncbi:MAG: YbhN family protein [Halobacteriales archaeon]
MNKTTRAWLRFAILLGLVLVSAYLYLGGLEIRRVAETAADASPAYLAAAAVVYALSWPPRGLRYRDVLAGMGHSTRTTTMTGAVFVSQTANLVFPARAGDASRAYVVKRRAGVPYRTGIASLAGERFLDVVTVGGLAATGVVLAFAGGESVEVTRHPEVVWGSAVLVVLAAGFAVLVHETSGDGLAGLARLPLVGADAVDLLQGFVDDVATVVSEPRPLASLLAWSLVAWGLDVAAGVLVLVAADVNPATALPAALLGVGVGNLAKAVPATPGGIGLYEAGFAASVTAAFPVAWHTALAAAVLDHALKNAVTVAGGVASAAALNVSLVDPGGDREA